MPPLRRGRVHTITEEPSSALFFIPLQRKSPELPPASIQPRGALTDSTPRLNAPDAPSIVESTEPAIPALRSDWRSQVREAARSSLEAQQRAGALKFAQADKPRKKCVKPKAPEWHEETSKYGLGGGFIPYIRFHNDRCIIVLTLFGCAFGNKPKADGTLFDNMNNYPNDSSVPDLDECEE